MKNINAKTAKNILNSLGVSINVFNMKGRRIYANPYYFHLSGISKNKKLSPDLMAGENKKKGEFLTKKVLKAIKTGKTFEVRNFFFKSHSKETRRYFHFYISPLKNERGKIFGAYTMVKDVTERFLAKRKLMRLNNMLERQVAERTEKLESANQQLRRLSKEKDFMVSDIAHEIKTILTIIKGNFEMLGLEQIRRSPMELECQKEIEEEIRKMSQIATNLVFISKSEQYADSFNFEKFDISKLIRNLARKYGKISKDRIEIILNSRLKKPAYLVADKEKISVLALNLIENAAKFSTGKARLCISLKKKDAMAHLILRDNGIGIDMEKIKYIFSPFFQVVKTNGNHSKKAERGFGLGLTICKKIVDAHKGKIEASSNGPGKGTNFEVVLPIKGGGKYKN